MKNPVRRRAFYTLMRCIAALALCTAFSLAVLLPAGRARVVTVGGVAAVMRLPGKLARGSELPLAVLCGPGEKFAPLAAALARRGVACVRLDGDVTADETAAVTAHMQTAYGTGRVVLAAYGKAGAMACGVRVSGAGRRRGSAVIAGAGRRGWRGPAGSGIAGFAGVRRCPANRPRPGRVDRRRVEVAGWAGDAGG